MFEIFFAMCLRGEFVVEHLNDHWEVTCVDTGEMDPDVVGHPIPVMAAGPREALQALGMQDSEIQFINPI